MEGGLLSLRWNDHGHTFFDMLSTIRRKEAYCDVTLVCDGRFYPVHKLVLSTCSDFFDHLFCRTDCKHPVVIVANVFHKDLEALLNYMYLGEVNVLQTELTSLMKAAEVLRIKGLAEPTKAPTKETRENKRSSSGEGIDSSVKRKRSEDVVSPSAKRSSPLTLNKTAAKEPSRSRVGNDSQTSKNSDQVNAPQSSSSSSSATGSQREQLPTSKVLPNVSQSTPQEPLVSSQNSTTEQESGSKAVRPEVKVEEILIKDEPGSWYGESDEGLDNLQFSETDPTLDYNSQTAASYSGNCLPWELAAAGGATQPHPIEGHFPQGMPGSSGMQGILKQPSGTPPHPRFTTSERGLGKVYIGGFAYTKNRSNGLREYWRCKDRMCPGRLILYNKEVVKLGKHTHPPEHDGKTSSDIIIKPTAVFL